MNQRGSGNPAGRGRKQTKTNCTTSQNLLTERNRSLVNGRKVAILWDIENVKPWSPVLSIPVQVYRIKRTFEQLGSQVEFIKAAINPRSWKNLESTGILEVLLASDVKILLCSGFSDAADKELIGEGYSFGHFYREQAIIVFISNDTGFCEVMHYLGSCGCLTVTMAPHRMKPMVEMLPYPPLHKLALPRASHLALMWRAAPGMEMIQEEWEWSEKCIQRCLEGGDIAVHHDNLFAISQQDEIIYLENKRNHLDSILIPQQTLKHRSHNSSQQEKPVSAITTADSRQLIYGSSKGVEAVRRMHQSCPTSHLNWAPGSVTYAWWNESLISSLRKE